MIPKPKRVRLKGAALKALNAAIHERDGHCCIICGRYVQPGEKFHHEPGGPDKSDVMEQGVTLCFDCHQRRHFGPGSNEIKERCRAYLAELYGDNDEQWR